MSELYLIRHAHAGTRTSGPHDRYRPLSDKGHGRAADLIGLLNDGVFDRIVSSPATRCSQTVEPLAHSRAIEIEETDVLWEGGAIDDVLALLEECAAGGAVICSHGDIIPEVIETLAHRGATIKGRGCEKGSIWTLTHDGTTFVRASYSSKREATLRL